MMRTVLELHGPDGRLRLARLVADDRDPRETGLPGPVLFLGLTLEQIVQVQRLTRPQVIELAEALDEWLFDTSAQGRPTVQRLNSHPPAV